MLTCYGSKIASSNIAKEAKMALLKSEERACYLEHYYLTNLKKQNLQLTYCSRKQESLAYTLQQESYLVFVFEIFTSLYVAKLAHFFKHFASLHFVKEAKVALLKREERTYYLEHHKNLLPCMM